MIRLAAAALTLLLAGPASARTLSGPEIGWTRLADSVLTSAESLAGPAIIIGVMLAGLALVASKSLPPIANLVIAGALLTLGSGIASAVLGASP